jgi:Trk-type K+ transport system membrane component
MTFTGFFGYFFTGGFSYKNQLMYTELLGENKIASVINTLYKIIFITLFFEAIGAIFIFLNVEPSAFQSNNERIYFSVFHSISAFCNAGFSTIEHGLNNPLLRFNYNLQIIIALLIILGGLGFGIVLNVYTFIKRWLMNFYNLIVYKDKFIYKAWIISFNSRIILYTTLFLICLATIAIFVLEYNNTLLEHQTLWGKSVTAFFLGVTPRTAGFSTVDVTHLTFPVILLYLFLMWIGASPGSTGGGIKTTTFAVAFLNIFSIAKGKDHIEIFKRQIASDTVKRALSIITLSFIVIGLAVFTLSLTDGNKGFQPIIFEVFSAFSTAGLSFGITPTLSDPGKIVLIFTMFIGRVGALTLLIAFIKNSKLKAYKYPTENMDL